MTAEQSDNMTPANPYLTSSADGFTRLGESWCERRRAKSTLQTRNKRVVVYWVVELTHACDLPSSV